MRRLAAGLLGPGLVLGLLILAALGGPLARAQQVSLGQAAGQEPINNLVFMAEPRRGLPIGRRSSLVLVVGINPGFHLNSDQPTQDWLTPTRLSFEDHPWLQVVEVVFPQAKEVKFSFAQEPFLVFDKMLTIHLGLEVSPEAKSGPTRLKGKLSYQACTETMCLPPAERPFDLELTLGLPAGSEIGSEELTLPVQAGPKKTQPPAWLLLTTFLGGLALNLTPCVYPLIPITVAYFSGQGRTRAGLLAHGGAYLAGLTATYTALGTSAGLSGRLFGSALQHPLVLGAMALLLVLLAGSMFGLYEFRLPGFLVRLGGASGGRRGLAGSLLMGLTLGLVAAPCLGPLTLGTLTFVAQSGQPVLGAAVFFCLSLGLGLPLAVLGLFSSRLVKALPASGPWLVWVRRIMGAVLVVMAIYLLRPLMAEGAWRWLMAGAALAGGLLTALAGRGIALSLRLAISLAWLVLAGFQVMSAFPPDQVSWPEYTPQRLAQARGRPMVLDFTADWCPPCRTLAQNLADPRLRDLAQKAAVFRVDLTDWRSQEAEELRRRYGIRGVPTLVFIGPDGREIKELRSVGVLAPNELIPRFRMLLALAASASRSEK
ncbi:MAG: thioredoxin family protein [Deltaproteobacteria bacterium]|nr:thioredoxin family protein [Deltaproteobacteria bacterium]